MPGNGGLPCSIDGVQVLRPMWPGRRVVNERAKQPLGRLVARITNSQEGQRVTRSVSNSHEGTDSGQESAAWLRVCPEG